MNKHIKHIIVPIFIASSILSTFLNKKIISVFPLSFFLLSVQSIFISFLLLILRFFCVIHFELKTKFITLWLPAIICMVAMVFSGIEALSGVSISLFTLFKNNTLIFIAVAELYLFKRPITIVSVISFFLMILSSALLSLGDELKNLVWLVINVFLSGLYVLVLKFSLMSYSEKQNEINLKKRIKYFKDKQLLKKTNLLKKNDKQLKNTELIEKKSENKENESIVIFSEKKKKNKNLTLKEQRMLFEENNESDDSTITDKMHKEAKLVGIELEESDTEFSALAYTQIFSIPFLLILSLFFDNYIKSHTFRYKYTDEIIVSPDMFDLFFIEHVLKRKKFIFLKKAIRNLLILKALIIDLFDFSKLYITDKTFLLLLLSSVAIFFVAFSSIKIISIYSSTTLSMLGATNKILLSFSGLERNSTKIAGILLGCLASVMYLDILRDE